MDPRGPKSRQALVCTHCGRISQRGGRPVTKTEARRAWKKTAPSSGCGGALLLLALIITVIIVQFVG
jgi:hypothetical protein